jgi:hypothetical protein
MMWAHDATSPRFHRPLDAAFTAASVVRATSWLAFALIAVLGAAVLVADRSLSSVAPSLPTVPSIDNSRLFGDPTPIHVTMTAGGLRAPWTTTVDELARNDIMWQRMALEDWNAVPSELRHAAFALMLQRYGGLLNQPAVWDRMKPENWDRVPQPIRTVAFRRMVAYWSGFYKVGQQYGLSSQRAAEVLAAVVMSESWFDHRAHARNRDGTLDIGLCGASEYARHQVRELHERGHVDVSFADADYYDPWKATRFAAVWLSLMLEESGGDLELAVAAYNRGTANARDSLGVQYLAQVNRRLSRFIRNQRAPDAWSDMWQLSRQSLRSAPP